MAVSELIEQVHQLPETERTEVILSLIDSMSSVGLGGLKKAIETRFDVSATGGGGGVLLPPVQNVQVDEPAERTEFDLFLKDAGQKKIAVIKEIRALTGLSLPDAKTLVEKAPIVVKAKMSREDVEKGKALIESAGGVAEIK